LTASRDTLTQGYQRQYDAVTVESLALATVGLLVFGTVAGWFFARLAGDVRRLEAHARHIVGGHRGTALAVHRDDELGRLMHAVNRMATDLDEREKQIEVDGRRRSHEDKMLAVGALAAGVAHEVNNPLAVIAGVAQELKAAPASLSPGQVADSAQLILVQAQRASLVARQLAEAASPQPAELDWVDLNALVRRVVQLMGYDRRYRAFGFEIRADPALPAVHTLGNAIQQVLMQMLALGCDAMTARAHSPATVSIATALRDGQFEVSLLFPPVLDFARAEVQHSLLLSRAIVEPLGARLAFDQVEGPGLRITLSLPSPGGDEQG
jgi:two-component system, NtrC family, sensor kinase